MRSLIPLIILMLSASATASAGETPAQPWRWELAPERAKALNNFERAQIEKGAKLYAAGDHRAAAGEFEKYKVQFQDSASPDMLAYANLMQGLCLLAAKDRNAAVRVFSDVLDYFADDIDDAGAALYFKGRAQIDSGDKRKGLESFQKMADDPGYRFHSLAAGAMRELADNLLRTGKDEQALALYRQVALDFAQANSEEARHARNALMNRALSTRAVDAYVTWIAATGNPEDPRWRVTILDELRHSAGWAFQGDGRVMPDAQARKEALGDFTTWFIQQKPWYDKAALEWWYFDHLFNVYCAVGGWNKERIDQLSDQVMAHLKAAFEANSGKPAGRDHVLNCYSWLVDRLIQLGLHDRALATAEAIPHPPIAGIKAFEAEMHAGKTSGIIGRLEAVENDPNAGGWATRATELKARWYKDRAGDYEKAIAAFQDLANPPGNLWEIQDCYRRWGKAKECYATLDEIEASFPDVAARAAWQKVQYLQQDGDQTGANRKAKIIVKKYRGSGEASAAHELLDHQGINAGGGEFEEGP